MQNPAYPSPCLRLDMQYIHAYTESESEGELMQNHIVDKNRQSWDDYSESYQSFNHADRILLPVLENPEKAFHSACFRFLTKHAGDVKNKRVFVPSSGDNLAVYAFARMGAQVTSCDISARQLDAARHTAEKIGLAERITFMQSDTMHLNEIPGCTYDLVYTSNGVHVWLNDLESMYENIHRVLVPGGVSVLYDVHPFVRPFDENMRVRAPYDCVGPFEDEWNITFHWRVSDILNAIASSGLRILEMGEWFAEKDYDRPFFIGLEDLVNGVTATREEVDEKHDWRLNPQMALPHWIGIASKKTKS